MNPKSLFLWRIPVYTVPTSCAGDAKIQKRTTPCQGVVPSYQGEQKQICNLNIKNALNCWKNKKIWYNIVSIEYQKMYAYRMYISFWKDGIQKRLGDFVKTVLNLKKLLLNCVLLQYFIRPISTQFNVFGAYPLEEDKAQLWFLKMIIMCDVKPN